MNTSLASSEMLPPERATNVSQARHATGAAMAVYWLAAYMYTTHNGTHCDDLHVCRGPHTPTDAVPALDGVCAAAASLTLHPKPAHFTTSGTSACTNALSLLRSRCRTPHACRCRTPLDSWMNRSTTYGSVSCSRNNKERSSHHLVGTPSASLQ